MKININNYKKFSRFIAILIWLSICLWYTLNTLINFFWLELPSWIWIPGIPTIYFLLFLLFDKYLRKRRIFKKIWLIESEDLSGIREGTLNSSYDNFESDIKATLTINQTATKIRIHWKFNESKSISLCECFEYSEIDNNTALFYFYKNEPNKDAINTMYSHEWSTKLIYNKESNSLEWYYFSGRDRKNHWTILVKRKNKKLN